MMLMVKTMVEMNVGDGEDDCGVVDEMRMASKWSVGGKRLQWKVWWERWRWRSYQLGFGLGFKGRGEEKMNRWQRDNYVGLIKKTVMVGSQWQR